MAKTKTCSDINCPVHHGLRTHGRAFDGTVTDAKSAKTATVQWQRKQYLPKFERYQNTVTRVHVHNPSCIDAKKGDIVRIVECKPLSKTKHFVVTEVVGSDYAFLAREELLQQAEVQKAEVKAEKADEKPEGKIEGKMEDNVKESAA